MRVLIVEDEKRLAATLRDLMEMNGFTSATTARAAWTTS